MLTIFLIYLGVCIVIGPLGALGEWVAEDWGLRERRDLDLLAVGQADRDYRRDPNGF